MDKKNIYQRMNEITQECSNIPKNGYNKFSKYKYVRAVDVFDGVQGLLVKHGVKLIISEDELSRHKEDKNFHSTIKCTATFINVDNPEDRYVTSYYSVSSDTLDKDIFKAKTNGLKYLFTQQFLIVTDDVIDTEESKPKSNGEKKNSDFNF